MAVLNQNLNRAFDLFELRSANKISFLDSYKKTLSKCCVDPLRPPDFSGLGRAAMASGGPIVASEWPTIRQLIAYSVGIVSAIAIYRQ